MLKGKRIVLGVSGSIAAYKAVDLASKLTQAGALVDVVLTREACEFVTPLTFGSLTHRRVATSLFDANAEHSIEHVMLAKAADIVVVAPATANVLAKYAHGLADDMLTTTLLATAVPVVVAPAMDGHMWDNPATQQNVATLRGRGVVFVGPSTGYLASGLTGVGRLEETAEIVGTISMVLGRKGDLAGKHIVVTAGGTQEPIDPVRVITNRSSGKMGYAIAEAARDRGASVTLIAAPTALPDPVGVRVVTAATARQMREAVLAALPGASALIMAAAVADFEAANPATSKIKKNGSKLTLELANTPDILSEAKGPFVRVGFAAESNDVLANAREKLQKKALDLIVANDITERGSGFGTETNRVVILDCTGKEESLPVMPKYDVAGRILDRVVPLLASKR